MRAPSWSTQVVRMRGQRGKVIVAITVAELATGRPHPAFSHLLPLRQEKGNFMSVVFSILLGVPRFLPSVAARSAVRSLRMTDRSLCSVAAVVDRSPRTPLPKKKPSARAKGSGDSIRGS